MSAPIVLKSADVVSFNNIDLEFNDFGRLIPAKSTLENELLSFFEQTTLINLLPFLERINFHGDQQVVRCDDRVSCVIFPESCVISEYQILEDGRTVEVAMCGKESAVGLSSIFDSEPATSWAQVTVPGSALKLNTQILREEFKANTTLQAQCFKHLNMYIRQLTQRVICHNYHTIEQRFCNWLLMICERYSNKSIPLTQERISRALGVHRPTLTNIAHSLREKEIIDYRRGHISIMDRGSLEDYSCQCHNF